MRYDFWIASFPRSGVTFTRMLLEQLDSVDTREIPGTVPDYPKSAAPSQEPLFQHRTAQIVGHKTHSPYEETPLPALVVARHPVDTIVSYAHYQVERRKKDGSIAWWIDQIIDSAEWSHFYHCWLRTPRRVVLHYEELLALESTQERLALVASRLHQLLALEGNPAALLPKSCSMPSFEELHAQWPEFYRKGKVSSGYAEMTSAQLTRLHALSHQVATTLGYSI